MCHLYGEEYDVSLHVRGRCSAVVGNEEKFGKHFLVPSQLKQEHRSSLLRCVENSKMFW